MPNQHFEVHQSYTKSYLQEDDGSLLPRALFIIGGGLLLKEVFRKPFPLDSMLEKENQHPVAEARFGTFILVLFVLYWLLLF